MLSLRIAGCLEPALRRIASPSWEIQPAEGSRWQRF
jgi:hypothetical protein